jgi:uncharacterized protein YunC (DUF1805 family)
VVKKEIDTSRIIVLDFGGNLPLIIYKGKKGYVASAYISTKTAEKVGDVAAITIGARNVEEFLKAKIKEVTVWAEDLGIREGMTVKKAIEILDEE